MGKTLNRYFSQLSESNFFTDFFLSFYVQYVFYVQYESNDIVS